MKQICPHPPVPSPAPLGRGGVHSPTNPSCLGNPGIYSPSAWPRLASNQGWDWGSTAISAPAIAGVMTIAELQSGQIDHALAVEAPEACAGWYAWPAQRSDGVSTDPNCLPLGDRRVLCALAIDAQHQDSPKSKVAPGTQLRRLARGLNHRTTGAHGQIVSNTPVDQMDIAGLRWIEVALSRLCRDAQARQRIPPLSVADPAQPTGFTAATVGRAVS